MKLQAPLALTHDGDMAKHYLSRTEFADRIGVTRGSLSNLKLPPADVIVGNVRGWSEKTIDEWNDSRPGRGGSWEANAPAKKK